MSVIFYNSPLFSFACRGHQSSLTDVLSSSVDPLGPPLISALIVSAEAVKTEWRDKQGWTEDSSQTLFFLF